MHVIPTPMSAQMPGDGVLVLTGEVTETALGTLRERLGELLESGERVRVDVTGVVFLPSAAIGVLVRTRSRARALGRELHIAAAAGSYAAQILQITGVEFDAS